MKKFLISLLSLCAVGILFPLLTSAAACGSFTQGCSDGYSCVVNGDISYCVANNAPQTTAATGNPNGNGSTVVPNPPATQTTPTTQKTTDCPYGRSVLPNGQQGGCNLGYAPLEPILGVTTNGTGGQLDFPTLLKNLFNVLFTIGALFSVVMLTISGIRYMLSDVVTDKEKAKQRIKACIYGLLLLAGSWLILNTINPQLLQFTLKPGTGVVTGTPGAPQAQTTGTTPQATTNAACNAYQYNQTACVAAGCNFSIIGAACTSK